MANNLFFFFKRDGFIILTKTQLKHVGIVGPQHHGGYNKHRYPRENPLAASQTSGERHVPTNLCSYQGLTNIPGIDPPVISESD